MTTAKLAVNRATYLLRDHAVLRGTARSPAFQSSVHQPPLCIEEHWCATKKWVPSCSSPALLFPRRPLLGGPFDSSLALLETGLFQRHGILHVGVAGYPEGHPKIAGSALDSALAEKIKQYIRANTTARHVPAKVVQVTDIPRTKSGKIVELAVRNVVHGRDVKNIEALANPEALEQYRDREELRT